MTATPRRWRETTLWCPGATERLAGALRAFYTFSLGCMLTFRLESSDIPAEHQLSREASEDVPTSAASLKLVMGQLWLWSVLGSVTLNTVVEAVA